MQRVWNRSSFRGWLAATAVLGFAGLWLAQRAESQPPPRVLTPGVLSVLKPHQSLAVKEIGGRYEFSLMPGVGLLGHEVVEVGTDYVVVRDVNDISQLRIPIYSIKAIITTQRLRQ